MKKEKIELIALFKSMGESVSVSLSPEYSEEGETLEFGRVSIVGDFQTLFSQYGQIDLLEKSFSQLIKDADALLQELAEVSEEKRVTRINELLSLLEA